RVAAHEAVVEARGDGRDLLLLFRLVDTGTEDEPPAMPRLVTLERLDVEPDDGAWIALRHLLDLDAALPREHEEGLLPAAVERQREIVLALDLGGLLDPEPAHDVPADVEAQDVAGPCFCLVGVSGQLDATGLAASAGEHLCLDDDLASELRRRSARL